MKFTLGLHKLPFELDSSQIIYVGGEKDEKVTNLIVRHFRTIRDYFASQGYTFCYIPYVKVDLLSRERLHYNAPFAKSSREADYMVSNDFILDYMIHPENRDKVSPSLLYYHPSCLDKAYSDAEDQMFGVTISEASFVDDEALKGALDEIIENIEEHREGEIRFHISEKASEEQPDLYAHDEEPTYGFAEDAFDEETKALIQEIEERVDKLRQKGIESYIIKSLFQHRKTTLSRMLITKDFRIYLGDYFGMEIEMGPLPKAVYLLFLRHPEGIVFKYLPDYREELKAIYRQLKPSFGTESTLQSIADVTNPTSNSINIIRSRIRAAFIAKFDEHLAQHYFITGKRGEPMRITLPRELVKWDK